MRLLVSVLSGHEAEAALAGGADIIDAKNPAAGPLGAVSIPVLLDIRRVTPAAHLVTAALGDAENESVIESMARAYAATGAGLRQGRVCGDFEHRTRGVTPVGSGPWRRRRQR